MSKQVDRLMDDVWIIMGNHFTDDTEEQRGFLEELIEELTEVLDELPEDEKDEI